ncbi:hypothetical protein WDU94_014873 [Cyamophila willieti]
MNFHPDSSSIIDLDFKMSAALAPPSPDAEARSICPLLATPSPTMEIEHPLAAHQLATQVSDADDIVILDTTLPEFKMNNDVQSITRSLTLANMQNGDNGSVCSALHVDQNTGSTSDNLLNSNVYYNLNCEENERMKARSIIQYLNKKQNYSFVYWNWPLIRRTCLCSMFSFMIVVLCTVVVMIMTQPKNCDPNDTWRRTAMVYEIFPASFQDSNNDGLGDLHGIAERIPYLKYLGVSIVRLNSIFMSTHYPDDFRNVDTLFRIDPSLGNLDDLKQLVDRIHSNNMSIILDLPILPPSYRIDQPSEWGRNHPNDTESVDEVLKYWLDQKIDGFYIKGVEQMQDDHDFTQKLALWRSIVDHYGSKILIASYHLVDDVSSKYGPSSIRMESIKATFDLIDFRLHSLDNMTVEANRLTAAYDLMDEHWILWSLSNNDKQRISPVNTSAAGVLLTFMLPGIPNVFYGEEIGLQNVQIRNSIEEHMEQRHLFQFSPMYWGHYEDHTSGLTDFTSLTVVPWMAQAPVTNVDKFQTVKEGFELRSHTPNIYMNGFCRKISFMKNFNVRYSDKSIIVVERIYPRKNPYLFVGNFGREYRILDLSRMFSEGRVLIRVSRRQLFEEFNFHTIHLYPGEAYVIKLSQ